MRKKYKLTVFARFMIFMAIFMPLAYVGVSYYQGEDGIQKIKELIDLDKFRSGEAASLPEVEETDVIRLKDQEIKLLKEEVRILQDKLEMVQQKLDSIQ